MEEKTRIKKCRECGIEFYGRLNQYFCSNKCRFDFNNSIARNNKEQINSILKILMRNREILEGENVVFAVLSFQLVGEVGKIVSFSAKIGS